jgi:hypothetical protein
MKTNKLKEAAQKFEFYAQTSYELDSITEAEDLLTDSVYRDIEKLKDSNGFDGGECVYKISIEKVGNIKLTIDIE